MTKFLYYFQNFHMHIFKKVLYPLQENHIKPPPFYFERGTLAQSCDLSLESADCPSLLNCMRKKIKFFTTVCLSLQNVILKQTYKTFFSFSLTKVESKLECFSQARFFQASQILAGKPWIFTTLQFHHNLRMGLISQSVCPRQAFLIKYNVANWSHL